MADRSPILLITRPEAAAEAFAQQVQDDLGRQVETVISPLIGIEPCEPESPIPDHSGLILTSANAVPAVTRLGIAKGTVAWCVGSRTAQAARALGFDARDAGGDAEALVQMILRHRPAGRLLHLRGEISRGDVADRLSSAGFPCEEIVVYRQNAQALSKEASEVLSGINPVVIPLFSPRTAAILFGNGPFGAPMHVVSMSEAVSEQLRNMNVARLETVKSPDGASMLEETVRMLRLLSPGAA